MLCVPHALQAGAHGTVKFLRRQSLDVRIIATKAFTHCKNPGKELEHLQIPYRTCFVEDGISELTPGVCQIDHAMFKSYLPDGLTFARGLLGGVYARWCAKQMANAAARHFNSTMAEPV